MSLGGPVLVELVGATNLTPASAAGQASSGGASSPSRAQIQRAPSELLTNPLTAVGTVTGSLTTVGGSILSAGGGLLSAAGVLGRREASCYVKVLVGGELVHKTEAIGGSNNPIWTVESGSLFLLGGGSEKSSAAVGQEEGKNKTVLLELRDQSALVPGKTVSIGTVRLAVEDVYRYAQHRAAERLEFPIANDLVAAAREGMLSWSEESEHGISGSQAGGDDDAGGDDGANEDKTEKKSEKASSGKDDGKTKEVEDDAPTLALRFRLATQEDEKFMSNLKAGRLDAIAEDNYGVARRCHTPSSKEEDVAAKDDTNIAAGTPQSRKQSSSAGRGASSAARRTSALLTEEDAANLAASVGGVMDSVKFTLSASQGRGHKLKLRVKPGPDPTPGREDKTRFLSEEELMAATYSPSKHWIEAGSGRHGRVLVEVLHCDGLPNCDPGGGVVGQKTTAFVSIVMEDSVVQTDTIPSCCSPQWMPWTRRAFACNRLHPFSSMYVGVFHFDPVNPLGHRGIGRVAINLQQFQSNHVYLLKFNLYNSPVYSDRVPMGSITLRLRLDQPPGTEKALLLEAIKPLPKMMQINVKKRKSLAVVKYTCYGQHPEDRFDIAALKSQAQEMLDLVQGAKYALVDAAKSLIFWRGQVSFGKVKFPLYSMLVYIGGAYVVERPYLLPSLFFWIVAFSMMASYGHRSQLPSPWYRGRPIADFASAFTNGKLKGSTVRIKAGEGAKETEGLQQAWQSRVELDAVAASKRSEMEKRVSEVEEAADKTSSGSRVPQIDPMAMLIPVQQSIDMAIWFPRFAKSIATWENSTAAFLLTAGSFAIAILLSVLPATWIIQWSFRVAIHLGIGPHMKLVDLFFNAHVDFEEEGDRIKHEKAMIKSLAKTFKSKNKMARINAEEIIKKNAMRKIRLGTFVAQVPSVNVTRFYDYPLPDSTTAPESTTLSSKAVRGWKDRVVVPGQQLYGSMIPVPMLPVEEEDTAVGDQDAAGALRDTDPKEREDDDNNESTDDDLQKLAEFNFQLAQAKAELDLSRLESRRATDERDGVKEDLAEKEKEVDRLVEEVDRLVEEMTHVSSLDGKLVDAANDDNKSSSVVNEDITIDENLEPVEELSTTEGAGPGSEASLNDEGGVASESDGPTGSATSTTEVEPHESKDTLLADPEDETSSRSQQRSSFTFGARDSDTFPEESQLYEIGLDDEDNTDPFATYDASARSAAMASAAEQPVTSPLRRFMQNRRKGEN